MNPTDKEQIAKLTEERDRARNLAAMLWDELDKTAELVARLNSQIEIITGKEQHV